MLRFRHVRGVLLPRRILRDPRRVPTPARRRRLVGVLHRGFRRRLGSVPHAPQQRNIPVAMSGRRHRRRHRRLVVHRLPDHESVQQPGGGRRRHRRRFLYVRSVRPARSRLHIRHGAGNQEQIARRDREVLSRPRV